ncbi:unnamed protein product [Vicia faba]|uniref:Uncharacterized protein n=1 Tax=Vicia faba TaxID=3906 RepID=A0AAV1ACD2_VICFA|nr:unnamed protein product [Vicia faba]
MNVLTPNAVQQLSLSFSKSFSCFEWQNKSKNVLSLTVTVAKPPSRSSVIRMGGGPRTYPGGVSKWQWKRMQAKKAKQLMKARLCRERQIYEMRKRAELKAAVSELEKPWEVVEKAPKLFSIKADEQLKVLADRFQKPGGFDLWTEKDGAQLFQTPDELPSARFFPKGVVHSIKPYMKVTSDDLLEGPDVLEDDDGEGYWAEDVVHGEGGSSFPLNYGKNGMNVGGLLINNGNERRHLSENVDWSHDGECSTHLSSGKNDLNVRGGLRKNGNGRRYLLEDVDSSRDGECSFLSSGRNELNSRGGLRKSGNGRRYLSQDVDPSYDEERSSYLSSGRNERNGRGGLRKNGNVKRYLPEDVDRFHSGERSSHLSSGKNELNVRGGLRKNENGRRYSLGDVDRSDNEEHYSSSNSGRNELNNGARMRKNGNGRKFIPKGVYESDDAERSSPSHVKNGASFDGKFGNKGSARRVISKGGHTDRSNGTGEVRSSRKESGRRFISKDVNGSNGMYAGRDGSGSTQKGSHSIRGRSYRKYTQRTSNNASPRVRDADSEVYDMGLQQDGSYQFLESEQSDSTNW